MSDRKFRFGLIKRSNEDPIPEDEPIFVLRARDNFAIETLMHYTQLSDRAKCTVEHLSALSAVMVDFANWRGNNRCMTKQPGITRGLPLDEVCPKCHVPKLEHSAGCDVEHGPHALATWNCDNCGVAAVLRDGIYVHPKPMCKLNKKAQAKRFLEKLLADGLIHPLGEIYRKARQVEVSESLLRCAKADLKVKSIKEGMPGRVVGWQLSSD